MIVTYRNRFFGVTSGLLFEARRLTRNVTGHESDVVSVDVPLGATWASLRERITRSAHNHDILVEFRPKRLSPLGVVIFRIKHVPGYLIEKWDIPTSEIPYKKGSKAEWYHDRLIAGGRKNKWVRVELFPGHDHRLARIAIANVCRDKKRSFKSSIEANGDLMFLLVD